MEPPTTLSSPGIRTKQTARKSTGRASFGGTQNDYDKSLPPAAPVSAVVKSPIVKQEETISQSPLSVGEPSRTPDKVSVPEFTKVNGRGIWNSWTRNFKTPLLACLDLLDNSLDAALHPGFSGKVHVERADPASHSVRFSGITLTNNSFRPIRNLYKVLEVYNSTKGSTEDSIGQNGVGLKQGCATLSDTSFVLARNMDKMWFGVIAMSLQRDEGCRLPSFSFDLDAQESLIRQQQTIKDELDKIAESDQGVRECITYYGEGDLKQGVLRIFRHFNVLLSTDWGDHCFRVVLTDLRHGPGEGLGQSNRVSDRAKSLMLELKEELPKNYLHLSSDFDFRVADDPVKFCYWQRRLVEMSRFNVQIDPKRLWLAYPKSDETWKTRGYSLKIYCGFDVLRASDDTTGSQCKLYIYSRLSGRLIKQSNDARTELGLVASGSGFCQGLTIVVDDMMGHLPLNPTKQDIAFGEQQDGAIHQTNFQAWIGAVTHLYWNFHAEKFDMRKKLLSDELGKCYEEVFREQLNDSFPSLQEADLTCFTGVQWTRAKGVNSTQSIRLNKKSAPTPPYLINYGQATKFRIYAPACIVPVSYKRKRKSPDGKRTGKHTPPMVRGRPRNQKKIKTEATESALFEEMLAQNSTQDSFVDTFGLDEDEDEQKRANASVHNGENYSRYFNGTASAPSNDDELKKLKEELTSEQKQKEEALKLVEDQKKDLGKKDERILFLQNKLRELDRMMKAMINAQTETSYDI